MEAVHSALRERFRSFRRQERAAHRSRAPSFLLSPGPHPPGALHPRQHRRVRGPLSRREESFVPGHRRELRRARDSEGPRQDPAARAPEGELGHPGRTSGVRRRAWFQDRRLGSRRPTEGNSPAAAWGCALTAAEVSWYPCLLGCVFASFQSGSSPSRCRHAGSGRSVLERRGVMTAAAATSVRQERRASAGAWAPRREPVAARPSRRRPISLAGGGCSASRTRWAYC